MIVIRLSTHATVGGHRVIMGAGKDRGRVDLDYMPRFGTLAVEGGLSS